MMSGDPQNLIVGTDNYNVKVNPHLIRGDIMIFAESDSLSSLGITPLFDGVLMSLTERVVLET